MTPTPETPLYLPDGKLMVNAGDMVSVPSDCCCGGSESPCIACTGRTPVSLQVLFSGLTVCNDCYVIGVGSYKFGTLPATPAGPYTLAQTGNHCVYEYSAAASGQIDIFATGNCMGGSAGYPFSDLIIRATFTFNKFEIQGWWVHGLWGPMAMYGPSTYFFTATIDPATVCGGPWTPANGLTVCNTGGPAYMAIAGTASVVSKWA